MRELKLAANGLNFRCLAAGPDAGQLVLMLHGFPEGVESWGAQLDAFGQAGYLAVAPDLRGYGETDCPKGAKRPTVRTTSQSARTIRSNRYAWGAAIGHHE